MVCGIHNFPIVTNQVASFPDWFAWCELVLAVGLAAWSYVIVAPLISKNSRKRGGVSRVVTTYVLLILAFGLAYHWMFSLDSFSFVVDPSLRTASSVETAQCNEAAANALQEGRRLVLGTVEALRDGRAARLLVLVRSLPTQLRDDYRIALISAVRPAGDSTISREEIGLLRILSGNPDLGGEEVESSLALPDPTYVHDLARAQAEHLRMVREFFDQRLPHQGPRGDPPRPNVGTSDGERLKRFLHDVMGFTFKEGESVDLEGTSHAAELAEGVSRIAADVGTRNIRSLLEFMYFSAVTMATLGYGDIAPNSPWAKLFAATQGVLGVAIAAFLLAATRGRGGEEVATDKQGREGGSSSP